MKLKPIITVLFLPGVLADPLVQNDTTRTDGKKIRDDDGMTELVEWLRSKGGHVSSKVELAPIHKNGEKITNGMFATSTIQKGEEILLVPAGATLIAGNPDDDDDDDYYDDDYDDDDDDDDVDDLCEASYNLVKEYLLGSESEFEPYLKHVFESSDYDKIPSAWSIKGSILFDAIVGQEMPPQLVDDDNFDTTCQIRNGYFAHRKLLQKAWYIIKPKAYDVLVPVYDMINHRNGHWHNVGQAPSTKDEEDVSIVALRDIDAGEQIYKSYNECHDTDCNGISQSYTLPDLLNDYGFVEQYPRRFNFPIVESEDDALVFELDSNGTDENNLSLTWLSDTPGSLEVKWMTNHLKRLQNMNYIVSREVDLLPSHEKRISVEYYKALMTALEQAIENSEQEEETNEGADEYDSLEAKPDELDYTFGDCQALVHDSVHDECNVNSHYQNIMFTRDPMADKDGKSTTCLLLSVFLQTCTTFRPHYHEVLVHYPASFVDTVKRVLFIGGGDNMIVHEILKYPNLDLVVGMELDQQVVRSSFKHLATQPHFDKDIVQWWFGDASKSLRMLPEQYFGTFDLVFVDLLTFVSNSLMVTSELSVMDFAMQLLKPDGVIVQNEDFVGRSDTSFAQYTVELELRDIPVVCRQSLNIGSNSIDFLRKKQKDHGIESLVFKPVAERNNHDHWWNYKKNPIRTTKLVNDETHTSVSGDEGESIAEMHEKSYGFVLILELENVGGLSLDSPEELNVAISQAVERSGLTKKSFSPLSSDRSPSDRAFIAVLEQGYVIAHAWPQHDYCAIDLMLWSDFDKQETIENEFVTAFDGQSSSSYRVVTTGMNGRSFQDKKKSKESNVHYPESDESKSTTTMLDQSSVGMILNEMSTLVASTRSVSVIAVLCTDEQKPCQSLDTLKEQARPDRKVVPVWACNLEGSNDMPEKMTSCKKKMIENLSGVVAEAGEINGLVIDSEIARPIGQVLHKILVDETMREKVLSRRHLVLVSTLDVSESWQKNLLERFRTDFVKFSPSHHAEIFFSSTTSENMKIGLFSAGDTDFYSNLATVVEKSEEKTGLTSEVKEVKDGILNWNSGKGAPLHVTDEDYTNISAYLQWKTQRPLGLQTILQFEMQAPLASIRVGQSVLVNDEVNVWYGSWYPSKVVRKNSDGTYVITNNLDDQETVSRNLIRRWESEDESTTKLKAKERVLYAYDDDLEDWLQGVILEVLTDDTYKLQCFTSGALRVVEREKIMRQMEPVADIEETKISTTMMKDVLGMTPVLKETVKVYEETGYDGFLTTGFWEHGRVIILYDGTSHINVNLFTYEDTKKIGDTFKTAFVDNVPSLTVSLRDEQPRGFGKVVSLERETFDTPHWVSSIEQKME